MMPVQRFGKCDWCGKHNTMTTMRLDWCPESGQMTIGWICGECSGEVGIIRELIKEIRGRSESQERTPRE